MCAAIKLHLKIKINAVPESKGNSNWVAAMTVYVRIV